MEDRKQNIIEFLDYSFAFIYCAIAAFLVGVFQKISDFLISAAISKYDARIEAKIKEQLKPIEEKLEKLSIEVHSTVSKKNYSNVRSELLFQVLEDLLGKESIKKMLKNKMED